MTHRISHTTRRRLLATAAAVTLVPSSADFSVSLSGQAGASDRALSGRRRFGLPGANRRCADGKAVGSAAGDQNRLGAATTIGAEAVARSSADGYTLLSGDNGTFVFNTVL